MMLVVVLTETYELVGLAYSSLMVGLQEVLW